MPDVFRPPSDQALLVEGRSNHGIARFLCSPGNIIDELSGEPELDKHLESWAKTALDGSVFVQVLNASASRLLELEQTLQKYVEALSRIGAEPYASSRRRRSG